MQVIGMGNTMMSGTLSVDKGTSVYTVLTQLASQNGLSVSGTKIYVKGIGDLLDNNDSVVWRYVNYE